MKKQFLDFVSDSFPRFFLDSGICCWLSKIPEQSRIAHLFLFPGAFFHDILRPLSSPINTFLISSNKRIVAANFTRQTQIVHLDKDEANFFVHYSKFFHVQVLLQNKRC